VESGQPLGGGDIGLGRSWHDAVDHGRRERAVGFDPGGEAVIAQRGEVANEAG
jgi:hypothetical protein